MSLLLLWMRAASSRRNPCAAAPWGSCCWPCSRCCGWARGPQPYRRSSTSRSGHDHRARARGGGLACLPHHRLPVAVPAGGGAGRRGTDAAAHECDGRRFRAVAEHPRRADAARRHVLHAAGRQLRGGRDLRGPALPDGGNGDGPAVCVPELQPLGQADRLHAGRGGELRGRQRPACLHHHAGGVGDQWAAAGWRGPRLLWHGAVRRPAGGAAVVRNEAGGPGAAEAGVRTRRSVPVPSGSRYGLPRRRRRAAGLGRQPAGLARSERLGAAGDAAACARRLFGTVRVDRPLATRTGRGRRRDPGERTAAAHCNCTCISRPTATRSRTRN
jgi:hypothetical protein